MLVLRIHFVTLQRDINFAGINNIPVPASPIHPGPASSARSLAAHPDLHPSDGGKELFADVICSRVTSWPVTGLLVSQPS